MPTARPRRIARALEEWFEKNRRDLPWRDRYDPWEVWVSEVMAQQTGMDIVVRRFASFIARFPTVRAMAESDETDVLAAWSGLGYYRRAKMLRRGAIEVVERFGGIVPGEPDELRSLPGVGRYTAGAIASIAFNRCAAIVDGNVARLAARLEAVEHPLRSTGLEKAAWALATGLVRVATSPRNLNQAAMELGASVCRPRKPRCDLCPLRRECRGFEGGRPDAFPRPAAKKATVTMTIPIFVVTDDRGWILMQEGSGALMDSLLHLPHGSNALLPGSSPESFDPSETLGVVRHSVTNRRIEFVIHRAGIRDGVRESRSSFVWVDPLEIDSIPLPSYVTKVLRVVGVV